MKLTVPERLEDGAVALRRMRPQDADPYATAFLDDPDLGRLLGVEADPDESSVRQRIESANLDADDIKFIQLAIADPVTDAFWGEMIVHSLHDHHRRGEIGMWVARAQRHRAVAAHACALIISWLFDEVDLLRVEMTTTPENQVLPVLARRLGFTQEGVLRARNIERGKQVDILWFGLLRDEWDRKAVL